MKEIIKSILSMVNDGKITAEEGVKLINAVKFTYNPSYERAKKMKNSVKRAVRDAEPKVKKAAEVIWDKSVEAAKGVKQVAGDWGEKIISSRDKKQNAGAYYDNMDFDEEAADLDWYEEEE